MTYWEERFLSLKDDGLRDAQKEFNSMSSIIQYALEKEVSQIQSFIQKYANANGISLQEAKKQLTARELKDFKLTLEQYTKIAQQKNLSQKQIKLLDNASIRSRLSRIESLWIHTQQYVEEMAADTNAQLTDFLLKQYQNEYYKAAYYTQSLMGNYQTFRQVPKEQILALLEQPWNEMNYSARIWKQRDTLIVKLQQEIMRSFIAQEPTEKITQKITTSFNVQESNARRLVETETAYVQETALHNCMNNLNVKEYRVLVTLDKHTSSICRHLDNKIIALSDFKPGITAPPFHPYCRSTVIPNVEIHERASRPNQKTKYIPDMNYQKWEDKYLK